MVLYKEFKAGDLFRIKTIPQISRGFRPELKEGEIPMGDDEPILLKMTAYTAVKGVIVYLIMMRLSQTGEVSWGQFFMWWVALPVTLNILRIIYLELRYRVSLKGTLYDFMDRKGNVQVLIGVEITLAILLGVVIGVIQGISGMI